MKKPESIGLKKFLNDTGTSDEQLFASVEAALGGTGRKPSEKIQQHPYFLKMIRELRKEISKSLTDPKKKARLQKVIFPELKALLVRRLQTLPIEETQRTRMIAKIHSVQLDSVTTCDTMSGPLLFRTTARYDSSKNSVRVCDGSLTENYSEFKLAHSIGHELSHSVDPCNLGTSTASYDVNAMEASYPLKGLIACLRSETSIAAKSWPADSPVGISDSSSKAVYDFCENDQINESVADWLSTEVVSQYLAKQFSLSKQQWRTGFSNIFRFNCDDPTGEEMSVHPDIAFRLNRLLLTQPEVRQKMACETPAKFQYCQVQP